VKFDIKTPIIWITGTDTGVGKTVLTALLLAHLRQIGSSALALKPFCSGGRTDAELLHGLQNDALTLDQINPFYFPEPVAPLVAARKHRREIRMNHVLRHIHSIISRFLRIENRKSKIENPTLLIEGVGGLLAPLGEPKPRFKLQSSRFEAQSAQWYTALNLINALKCRVIVVAPNRLGAINHTLLIIRSLQSVNVRKIKVVLTEVGRPSSSRIPHHASRSNPSILTELLFPIPLFHIPNLGRNPGKPEQIHRFAKKLKKTLAEILA